MNSCWGCGGNHHIRSCTEMICKRCSLKGHLLVDCPNKATGHYAAANVHSFAPTSASGQSASRIWITAVLGGQAHSALIDNGATCSVLDESALAGMRWTR